MDEQAWLTRLSLDLRGTRPSLDELEQVEGDPDAVLDLVDDLLADDRFPGRMAWLWNDTLHTAVWAGSYDRFAQFDEGWDFEQWRSVGLEPLKMVEMILKEDRPMTEMVTRTEIPSNPVLAALWETDYTGDEGWGWANYLDGRPMAGLLSSKTLWLRYKADALNFNRHRANTVSTIFLCSDFFDRQGTFSFSVDGDFLGTEDAITSLPECTTCHAALDPLAAFFGGFAEKSTQLPTAQFMAYSEFMADWTAILVPPAYYGHPGRDIVDLGAMIAADPRFSACMVERFYEGLVGESLALGAEKDELVGVFVEGGQRAVPLIRKIVQSKAYRSSSPRMLTTDQLYTALTELTAWNPAEASILDGLLALQWSADHRLMGGGTDDDAIVERSSGISLGNIVLMEWVGRQATGAIAADLEKSEGHLFPDGLPTTEDEARILSANWLGRFHSNPVGTDDEAVDRLVALWQAAGSSDSNEIAWGVVLQAMIRHPETMVY